MKTPYFADLHKSIVSLGGYCNAHLHLDRAATYHDTVRLLSSAGQSDGTSLSLPGKHAVIPAIHASECYSPSNMAKRIQPLVEAMIASGTYRADTVVDVTADEVGLLAVKTFESLRLSYADYIDLRIGAYSPLGFRDDEPERWSLIQEAAERCDFIGLLPERDDHQLYPAHIGFEESCRRGILLSQTLGKPIHIHVDQANHCYENASEKVVDIVDQLGIISKENEEPLVWLVHCISPSTYPEQRFQSLAAALARLNIGVIVCPSAAISMRQYRTFLSPTYNSIARALDLIAAGVHIRLGSDNVCDITSPMGTVDLLDEVKVFGDALRYYNIDVLARVAAGKKLGERERADVKRHLERDKEYIYSETIKYS